MTEIMSSDPTDHDKDDFAAGSIQLMLQPTSSATPSNNLDKICRDPLGSRDDSQRSDSTSARRLSRSAGAMPAV
jgi:hypothetical protein